MTLSYVLKESIAGIAGSIPVRPPDAPIAAGEVVLSVTLIKMYVGFYYEFCIKVIRHES